MTWRDKLEIGLKHDAPFRRDNLPDDEVRGPERPAGEGRSPVVTNAEARAESRTPPSPAVRRRKRSKRAHQ